VLGVDPGSNDPQLGAMSHETDQPTKASWEPFVTVAAMPLPVLIGMLAGGRNPGVKAMLTCGGVEF
jgi:hypothetical protein